MYSLRKSHDLLNSLINVNQLTNITLVADVYQKLPDASDLVMLSFSEILAVNHFLNLLIDSV